MRGEGKPEPPRLVVALGLYRSASTWVANVAAELLRLQGPSRLVNADRVDQIAAKIGGGASVIKAHHPDASFKMLIHVARLPVIISVRDPADCVASLIEQFKEPYANAAPAVAANCNAILQVLPVCEPLILHYEAPGARDAQTVVQIAAHLRVPIRPAEAEALAARFTPAEVQRLIDRFTAEGVYGADPRPHHVHAETQWHPGHLGTGVPARQHAVLSPRQIAEVQAATTEFRKRFGYSPSPAPVPSAG